jgi:hypothetical protein
VERLIDEETDFKLVSTRWVPKKLNASQLAKRVEFATAMLITLKPYIATNFFNLLTGDETWIFHENFHNKAFIHEGEERPERARRFQGSKKTMLTVFWGGAGIRLVHRMPPGETMNSDKFISDILMPLEKNAI